MAGTISFEKTAFFVTDVGIIANDSQTSSAISSATFSEMYTGQTSPSTTAKIRGYEIYIDTTTTADYDEDAEVNKVVTRLARVSKDSNYDTSAKSSGKYDVYVSSDNIVGQPLSSVNSLTFKNISGASADFRIVYVVG